MRFLILNTLEDAQEREARLSLATGYPRPSTKTDRVVQPITHEDGRAALPIPSSVWSWAHGQEIDLELLLDDQERAALCTGEDLQAHGWFAQEGPL